MILLFSLFCWRYVFISCLAEVYFQIWLFLFFFICNDWSFLVFLLFWFWLDLWYGGIIPMQHIWYVGMIWYFIYILIWFHLFEGHQYQVFTFLIHLPLFMGNIDVRFKHYKLIFKNKRRKELPTFFTLNPSHTLPHLKNIIWKIKRN